ncbi:hypothetical protein BGZ50_000621, partial [Haplosporangium sp. Z 11]
GFKAYVKQKKLVLKANHKDKRYRFARERVRWTVDDWKATWKDRKQDDAAFYVQVLRNDVLASRDYYGMDPATFIFQQDNARVHTADSVKKFFARSHRHTLLSSDGQQTLQISASSNTSGRTSNTS